MKNKLPKRLKNKWIKALLSGKYKQGVELLYSPKTDSYCCLGVCEIVCGNTPEYIENVGMPIELGEYSKLPSMFLTTDFFKDKEGNFTKKMTIPGKLANFNDKGKSFKWIAAYIKRYL